MSIRGNPNDVLSQGHLCPKATALADLHNDPDRLHQPVRRQGDQWSPITWEEALEETAERLHGIQEREGKNAVAVYFGNPNAHSYSTMLAVDITLANIIVTRQLAAA